MENVEKIFRFRSDLTCKQKKIFDKAIAEFAGMRYKEAKNPIIRAIDAKIALLFLKTLPCPYTQCDNLTCRKIKCIDTDGLLRCWKRSFRREHKCIN